LLVGVNAQARSFPAYLVKMNQLFLERHFDEAIRLIQNRLTEFRDMSDIERFLNPFFLLLAHGRPPVSTAMSSSMPAILSEPEQLLNKYWVR
jgi:hypothetical protein